MNRTAAWLILISYSLMACGNILETGCCRDEAAHAFGEHTAHRHAHSKVLVAVHGLSHWVGLEDTQRLVSRHCCCVSQGEQEPGLPPHSLTPRLVHLRFGFPRHEQSLPALQALGYWSKRQNHPIHQRNLGAACSFGLSTSTILLI